MPLRLYMDVHIPSAITSGSRRRGVDVLTSQEDGTREMADAALLLRSTELSRVLYSQDTNLLAIAQDWQKRTVEFSGLVYSHPLGPGIGSIIDDLELLLTCATVDELQNSIFYLPLR